MPTSVSLARVLDPSSTPTEPLTSDLEEQSNLQRQELSRNDDGDGALKVWSPDPDGALLAQPEPWRPPYPRLTGAALVVMVDCLVLFIVSLIRAHQSILTMTLRFGQTWNGVWLVFMSQGLHFSLLLLSSIDGTRQLLHSANGADGCDGCVLAVRRPSVGDCAGMAFFMLQVCASEAMVYAPGEGAYVAMGTATLFVNAAMLGWAVSLMRVSIVRTARLHVESHLAHLRRCTLAVLGLQVMACMYVFLLGWSYGNLPLPAHYPPSSWGACDYVNASYLRTKCVPAAGVRIGLPPEALGDPTLGLRTLGAPYACDDGELLGRGAVSAFAVCYGLLASGRYSSCLTTLFAISGCLPTLIVLSELRRGQQLRHSACLRLGRLGDLCFAALGLLLLLLVTTFVLKVQHVPPGNSEEATQQLQFYRSLIMFLLTTACALCYSIEAVHRGLLRLIGADEHTAVDRYTCFCSHDWGLDGNRRSNHERVKLINRRLQSEGLSTWFDVDRMRGDINASMTEGIDRSTLILVFVTRNYVAKAAGVGPRGLSDNVYAEFAYSLNRRGVERMIAVVMEPNCCDTSQWHGAVGLRLGARLYVNLSADTGTEDFEEGVRVLIEEVRMNVCRLDEDEEAVGGHSEGTEMGRV